MIRASLILSVCAAFSVTASGAEEAYVSYSGTAFTRHSHLFLYGEQDWLKFSGDHIAERVVLYTCRDGSAFARKTVSYVESTDPDFLLEDVSNGMREGVRTAGKARTVFYGDRKDAEKSKPLPKVPGLVADAGFDEFIRAHWPALVAGQTLSLNFLVPSRLEDISFQVQRVRSDTVDGKPAEVFRLKLSGILGWLIRGIEVYYSEDQHTLVRYDGLSDLRDASLDNWQTEIHFPSARQTASRQALEAARTAPLTACRASVPAG